MEMLYASIKELYVIMKVQGILHLEIRLCRIKINTYNTDTGTKAGQSDHL